jgi:hypothetical protein
MKIPNYNIVYFLLLLICSDTSCIQKKASQGSLRKSRYYFDHDKNKFLIEPQIASTLIWYLDQYVIKEVRGLSSTAINGKTVSIDTSVTHYTFYDLVNNHVYYYDTFSVDAKLLKELHPPRDSLIDGWNFQRSFPLLGRDNLTALSDTLIQGHLLKRLQTRKLFTTDSGTIEHLKIGYIRSDLKASLFHLDKPLDDSLNATMVRMDFWVKPTNIAMSSSFEFLRHELTKDELSVFESWIKRTKTAK